MLKDSLMESRDDIKDCAPAYRLRELRGARNLQWSGAFDENT